MAAEPVIDGDTVAVAGARVRLYGIDAPERGQRCRYRGQPWDCGREAAAALSAYVAGRAIDCADVRDRDRYGRPVAVCRVDGADLGAWLVRQGWAVAYTRYSWRYVPEEMAARLTRRGLWSGEFQLPEGWRADRR